MPKLTKLQKSFLRSERDSVPLLERLAAHLAKDAQVPSDLKEAFIEAVKAGVRGHIKSWDEVFGRPNTSQQYEEFCKALELGFAIEKMADQAKGHLNEERFEKIGKELGISSTKTKETLNWWRRLRHQRRQNRPKIRREPARLQRDIRTIPALRSRKRIGGLDDADFSPHC